MMRYERSPRGHGLVLVHRSALGLCLLLSAACARPQPSAHSAEFERSGLAQSGSELNAMREALQTRDERIKQLESRLAMVEAEQRQFRYALEEKAAVAEVAQRRDVRDDKESKRSARARSEEASAASDAPRVMLRLHEDNGMPQEGGIRLRGGAPLQDVPVVSERLAVVPLPSATPVLLNAAPNRGSARALPAGTDNADDTYGAALDALAARDFRNASALFARFLDEHPGDARFAKAVYWRAEALFALQSYAPARAGFEAYLGAAPRGERAADAWLKLGHCRVRTGDRAGAKAAFHQLRREFPDSPAARMAAEEAL